MVVDEEKSVPLLWLFVVAACHSQRQRERSESEDLLGFIQEPKKKNKNFMDLWILEINYHDYGDRLWKETKRRKMKYKDPFHEPSLSSSCSCLSCFTNSDKS